MRSEKGFVIFSWALYDLANQFFALNVVSLYFPRWLMIEKGAPEILYSITFGLSMFLVAVRAPLLGALSDEKGRRRYFLVLFTLISVLFTMGLGLSSGIFLGLVCFAIANFGCQEAIVFYNALMVEVAPKGRIGLVSGMGRMFGYTGAILALYLTKPVMYRMGYQAAFLVTGILFFIFSLPCLIFVKETRHGRTGVPAGPGKKKDLLRVFREIIETLLRKDKFTDLKAFLRASFFVLCAINTMLIFMAIYAGKVFGLDEGKIIDLIAFSTLFAIVGSIISGFISDIIGLKKAMLGVFSLWGICVLAGGLLYAPFHWLVGALVGISLGGTWVVFRALVIRLVPEESVGEAFGLFNLVGYLAGITGPLIWGLILMGLSRYGEQGYRVSFLSLLVFIVIGIILLLRLKDTAACGK